ncbi:hypothetical protein [Acuticoccus mangrovi]|uniref:Uncharacterized protein n=1 Tax=Acuticoccus mangrovi TaxID=2796142 RepID=A0A934MGY7_9HYPH|nr:hypothetical protein [Acuticoccus mangrovi]MBJ3776395.1 hypothetical protein [Acuticoccus mangrovi]
MTTRTIYSDLGDEMLALADQTTTVIDAVVTRLADGEREFADRALATVQRLRDERAMLSARNEAIMTALLGEEPPAMLGLGISLDGPR